MKTLLKVLTPTISTIGIATIALTSCNANGDGYVAIPSDKLDIDGTSLVGLKDPTEPIKDYDKLTVPKTIETVSLIGGDELLAYNCIKKIDYESDSSWKSITNISSLSNLEVLVLPPKLDSIEEHAVINCKKINTIDISNVEDLTSLSSTEWIYIDGTTKYDSGTLIIKHSQADKVQTIKEKNTDIVDFQIKEI